MAVDTRQKRFSMMSFGSAVHFVPLFEADSSVDLDDRQHLLNCYSGISFASPSGEVTYGGHMMFIPDYGIGFYAGRTA